jgi:predicted nucleotidyltransferase/HEPN domain-containing protein
VKLKGSNLKGVWLEIKQAGITFTFMKKSLEHLPQEKIEGLERVVSVIREMCDDIEMIILFGSHARGDYRDEEDLKPDRKSGAVSDFDILAVCGTKETAKNSILWHKISQECNGLDLEIPFRIIVHDIGYLKKRLKEIHYFFSDIVREGCLLYSSGKCQINVAKTLPPKERAKVAEEHFEHWFERGQEFYQKFQYSFSIKHKTAAFDLHQCAESLYKALLLVFTNYAPHDHYLESADKQVHEILPEMEEIFPCKTQADFDRFKNFDYAYIGARYDKKYEISRDDLVYFSSRVKRLLELTEELCKEEIKRYL